MAAPEDSRWPWSPHSPLARFVFVRDDDGRRGRKRPGGRRLAQGRQVVRGLDAEQQVDQVLLLGFDGTDASAPIVRAAQRQLGGVLVGQQNGASPGLVTAIARAGRPAAGSRR